MNSLDHKNIFPLTFKREFRTLKFSAKNVQDYLIILMGAVLQAFAVHFFIIPSHLVSGGLTGLSLILNYLTNAPIGLMVVLGNIPLFFLGWRYLGGLRFALRSAFAIFLFSVLIDLFAVYFPDVSVTDDLLLNTVYGALLSGIGLGLVYRGKGTTGGTDILGRILNHKLGISISNSYLLTDSIVVLAGGFIFTWKFALYGLAVIYISGLAAEMAFEGRAVYRTAMIVSSQPSEVSKGIMQRMDRGVTLLFGEGAYSQQKRDVIYVVITQSEIPLLKEIVQEADINAFMVIGQVHEVLGNGFRSLQNEN